VALDMVRAGDVVMVKGSYGSKMIPVAEALLALDRAYAPNTAATGRG
jgi:hypothetical protein